MKKEQLEGKFLVAYDTICDGWQCVMTEDDAGNSEPALYNTEDEAFTDIFFDARGMLAHREPEELAEMEVSQELIDQMSKLYDSKDVAAMRKMFEDHPQLNYNEEWVEPAEQFVMNRKVMFDGEAFSITGKTLADEQ